MARSRYGLSQVGRVHRGVAFGAGLCRRFTRLGLRRLTPQRHELVRSLVTTARDKARAEGRTTQLTSARHHVGWWGACLDWVNGP